MFFQKTFFLWNLEINEILSTFWTENIRILTIFSILSCFSQKLDRKHMHFFLEIYRKSILPPVHLNQNSCVLSKTWDDVHKPPRFWNRIGSWMLQINALPSRNLTFNNFIQQSNEIERFQYLLTPTTSPGALILVFWVLSN